MSTSPTKLLKKLTKAERRNIELFRYPYIEKEALQVAIDGNRLMIKAAIKAVLESEHFTNVQKEQLLWKRRRLGNFRHKALEKLANKGDFIASNNFFRGDDLVFVLCNGDEFDEEKDERILRKFDVRWAEQVIEKDDGFVIDVDVRDSDFLSSVGYIYDLGIPIKTNIVKRVTLVDQSTGEIEDERIISEES